MVLFQRPRSAHRRGGRLDFVTAAVAHSCAQLVRRCHRVLSCLSRPNIRSRSAARQQPAMPCTVSQAAACPERRHGTAHALVAGSNPPLSHSVGRSVSASAHQPHQGHVLVHGHRADLGRITLRHACAPPDWRDWRARPMQTRLGRRTHRHRPATRRDATQTRDDAHAHCASAWPRLETSQRDARCAWESGTRV